MCVLQAAIAMHSGEGECVEFASECACEGPVETWLQSVVDSMKAAIQAEFKR
jgi:dynein heavy chain